MRLRLPTGHELRPLEESDADELHALIDANRARLVRWMVWAEGHTFERTLAFIRDAQRQLTEDNGFQAAIVSEGTIVGVAGFHGIDWPNRATTIGYWLGAGEEGRGTMTHAVRALVDHAFEQWELNRVEIRIDVENHRSRAVAERLGFVHEGTLREALRLADGFHDDAVYAMLVRDWRERV
ncbi:MAG TPA: GNAT family protein [Solirubrobacteraceae bacterium]|jgi:ribosomal-protein-serine acetyltransferase|nr:GNAT family protein [Solirubrobacteraceae bacterium]